MIALLRDTLQRSLKLTTRISDRPRDRTRSAEAQASPRFAELDAYSKAAVIALLDQADCSLTTEQEANYVTSAGELINRVLGPGESNEPDQERELAIRREADTAVLELLRYAAMDRRRSDIGQTFASSCQWIFEKPVNDEWVDLPEWLSSGSGLYLIAGKEASGKSTLMKYILTHPQTVECLKRWAQSDCLATAGFYFWRSGTRLEKSEEGLLRSLLYSALEQQPHLAPNVFPKEWSMFYALASGDRSTSGAGLGVWRVEELRDAFRRLVNQTQIPLKLFFLVDGIDEYQQGGSEDDFTEIIEFFKGEVATSANVKALVSSRPLEAFDRLGFNRSSHCTTSTIETLNPTWSRPSRTKRRFKRQRRLTNRMLIALSVTFLKTQTACFCGPCCQFELSWGS